MNNISDIYLWIHNEIYHNLINIETKEDYEKFISNNKMTRLLAYYNSSMAE